ncbi:MAG: hypothetical protein AB8F74_06515, partial [Saprospiraceae bacterium]
MKLLYTVFFLQIYLTCTFAQVKHDYVWSIGQGVAPPGNTVDAGMNINFNDSSVSISSLWRDIDIEGTNASMSDAEGNLIFYTNGCKIFNANHELMENGNNINAGEVNDIQCPDDELEGAYTLTNGIMALTDPGSDSLYYLIHLRKIFIYDPFDVRVDRLLYSVINMNKNNGLGAVIEKDITIILDTLMYNDITAVRHSNGKDWWIQCFQYKTDTVYTVSLTEEGIADPVKYKVGAPSEGLMEIPQSCISPDGSKFVRYNRIDHVFLYDFDRSIGRLSNFQQINVAEEIGLSGTAISPNSRFLYTSTGEELYQFDLWATDIESSKVLVGVYDGFLDPFPTYFRRMQLGPDC